jgi:hypothetical protein
MTGNLHLLDHNVDASKCPPVIIANGSKVSIEKKKSTQVLSSTISNVFYLPTLTSNLLSVSKITKTELQIHFLTKQCDILGHSNEEDD